ncbi:MAG TPA: DUF4442 domain-containing protein [Salinimicrobium sp.]|nr:DUF4442 domain-containing protein [Salinimicrobium sp.]
MTSNLQKLNAFIMIKVPAAWLCGVRNKEINQNGGKVGVKHRWINQNPFNSMYFAVQAMAAELSTGALVMQAVKNSGRSVSMLVKSNNSNFSKKATGKLIFECADAGKIKEAIDGAVETAEGKTFWLNSTGTNEAGEVVSTFNFEWTIRLKEY